MFMRIAVGLAALALATPVLAQDATTPPPAADAAAPRAPDGSRAFGLEPYVGVMGGYEVFDRHAPYLGNNATKFEGALIEGVVGVNVPLGPVFVGIEGHGAKGLSEIDWEYGARARAGFRAGDSGLIYASIGHTWIEARDNRGFANRDDWVYGIGVEVGPKDIGLGGLTGNAGPRLRISAESYDFKSLRPMAGLIFHF